MLTPSLLQLVYIFFLKTHKRILLEHMEGVWYLYKITKLPLFTL